MFNIGDVVGERYEVTGVLERQPVGHLYRAVERRGGGTVFLWLIGAQWLPDAPSRNQFINHMTRVYGVRHPNALPLLDVFQYKAFGCLAIQCMEGPTLAQHIVRRKAERMMPSRSEAWGALTDIASAASQFHQLGMVVGDLRPEAVLVTQQGIKLLDLAVGMAVPRKRFVTSMHTRAWWPWLAPELREGRPFDRRADVYSLAAIAHFIFYGERHGWSDGTRRGLFASAGRWLRFGGRPKVRGERWPLVDSVLKRSLHGLPIVRPNDVEIFCRELEQALAQSPERRFDEAPPQQQKKAKPVKTKPAKSKAPLLQERPQGGPMPSAPVMAAPPMTANASARTAVAEAPKVVSQPPAQQATVMADIYNKPVKAYQPPPAVEEPKPVVAAPPPVGVHAATMMADVAAPPRESAPPPSAAPSPLGAPPSSGAPAATMMADLSTPRPPAAAPPPADAPLRAPSLSTPPDAVMSITAELPPTAAPSGQYTTRQVDTAEINELLAHDNEEHNKTREINSAEIERLLAQTRDPDKK
jgi:serine/threonine protein kinase